MPFCKIVQKSCKEFTENYGYENMIPKKMSNYEIQPLTQLFT